MLPPKGTFFKSEKTHKWEHNWKILIKAPGYPLVQLEKHTLKSSEKIHKTSQKVIETEKI